MSWEPIAATLADYSDFDIHVKRHKSQHDGVR